MTGLPASIRLVACQAPDIEVSTKTELLPRRSWSWRADFVNSSGRVA